ncbi:MAG: hypothetical protein D6693_08065, partial [Planctomycetota bacterium]
RSGRTLREWIEEDPAGRGELTPFTDLLTEWAPPEDNIPEIREALFRAGRLYYNRFFRELDYDRCVSSTGEIRPRSELPWSDDPSYEPMRFPPERFYRPDILAPWEAPEPIPEIFTARFLRSLPRESWQCY